MSLTRLTTPVGNRPDRDLAAVRQRGDAAAERVLLEAFAAGVAAERAAAGSGADAAIGADTARELLAVVEALTRREVARGVAPSAASGERDRAA